MDLKSAYQIQQRFIRSDEQFQLNGLLSIDKLVLPEDFLKIEQGSEDRDDDAYDELIFIETESQIDCIICGFKCENERELYEHNNTHYIEEQCCDTCLVKLPNMVQYQSHLVTHHPDQAKKTYCCGNCSLTFKFQSLYNLHLASVHPSKSKQEKRQSDLSNNNLKCEECSKVCRTIHSYKSHVKGSFHTKCRLL